MKQLPITRRMTLLAFLLVVSCESLAADDPPKQRGTAEFPLKVSADRRYLVDQKGKPFLVVGDTAWSLIADLRRPDIEKYLEDRSQRGFNAIIVNLIEHKFSSDPPRNRAGTEPFHKPGDFSMPNPAYFKFAHDVIQMANERGISVWLCPAYLGWGGKSEGFFQEIKAGGPQKLKTYGRFVGETFKDLPNIIWMVGGDYALPKEHRWAAVDLALAIREGGARQLLTAHGGQQSAAETVGNPSWLDINNTYSYHRHLFYSVRTDAGQKPMRPLVLIESTYENEHDARPEQIRRQAYWAMTSGACGQFFGNNPIWHFDGPGLFPVQQTWEEALDGTGSRDMARLREAFQDHSWHELVPDWEGKILTKGQGDGRGTATTAATPDGKLAMIYIPSTGIESRELEIDLSRFAGPVSGIWFNPTNERSTPATGKRWTNAGKKTLHTPGDNGTKTNDWLLVLTVQP